jgi:hypothetical protein
MRIQVTVDEDGQVLARRLDNNATSDRGPVGFRGLDRDLVRLFERWLTIRDRAWREEEISTFGALLHRCLFPDAIWSWIERTSAEARGGVVRLELVFPSEGAYSRMSAVPWEYLFRPERQTERGRFLATDPKLVLCRYITSGSGEIEFPAEAELRLLVAVSQPRDSRLGEVEYEEVLAEIRHTAESLNLSVTVLNQPTARSLYDAVHAPKPPHLLHFMGHGNFDAERGEASLALVAADGTTDWVDDRRLADLLTRGGVPLRAVVLHSCEGGFGDFSSSFAGLAPQLARSGVQSVVAMQYAVTNETAIEFSLNLYRELAGGADLDTATQTARFAIHRLSSPADPRLVGVPVVYLQSRHSLLTPEASARTAAMRDG